MIFILGYITGSLITLALTLTMFYVLFHNQKPIERQITQWILHAKPKGDFIQTPTDSEIVRKDKLEKLSKIKTEIRLSDILDKEI